MKTLSISTLNQTNIPPKEIVAYNKETQTPVIQKSTESGTIEFYSVLWFTEDSRKGTLFSSLKYIGHYNICRLCSDEEDKNENSEKNKNENNTEELKESVKDEAEEQKEKNGW